MPASSPNQLRADKLGALLSLLDQCPTEVPPADLVGRAAERVAEARRRQQLNEQIASLSGPTIPFRLSDLLAVAAAVLIAASLTVPMLSRNQAQASRILCANNQATTGRALGHYAADHNLALPQGRVRQDGKGVWYRVGHNPIGPDGTYQSNSAHLRIIVRGGYLHWNTLNCPGNADAPQDSSPDAIDWRNHQNISYSWRLATPQVAHINRNPQQAVLADRNPSFRIQMQDGQVRFTFRGKNKLKASSTLHGGQGQNVLTPDGKVHWTTSPKTPAGDNIWAIRDVEDYWGNETPHDPDDIFLVP
jgi:hypothetical protein